MLNLEWVAKGRLPFQTRFGLHTGSAIVGNVGSMERMNYTVMGDAVNLASRLEGANKFYGTSILVSDQTRQQAGDEFLFRPVDLVRVMGRTEGVRIYELVADQRERPPESLVTRCRRFDEAFEACLAREWEQALSVYEELQRAAPDDEVAALLTERCRELIGHADAHE
ncbi:MAG: adenylate/guanylate cyclase domain-containing protein [Planctomycetes bacterium]|nr:adenylate/guanylate cyclase domain-containing protein [Planctomycetota bacterium]